MMLTRLAATASPLSPTAHSRTESSNAILNATPPPPSTHVPLPTSPPRMRVPPFLSMDMGTETEREREKKVIGRGIGRERDGSDTERQQRETREERQTERFLFSSLMSLLSSLLSSLSLLQPKTRCSAAVRFSHRSPPH